MAGEDDDRVGYKRPPRHSQFKPGKSGNPKGRPKRSTDTAEILRRVLTEKIAVTVGGKRISMTKLDAMVFANANRANRGDSSALLHILNLDSIVNPSKPASTGGGVIRPSLDEWIEYENSQPGDG